MTNFTALAAIRAASPNAFYAYYRFYDDPVWHQMFGFYVSKRTARRAVYKMFSESSHRLEEIVLVFLEEVIYEHLLRWGRSPNAEAFPLPIKIG